MDSTTLLIAFCFLAAAALYASVGHAGASGYLAVMGLFGLAPEQMRPTALILNILVAVIAGLKFYRAGYFNWTLFWPFAVTSAPAAFVGGRIALPSISYRVIVGAMLLYAAWRLFRSAGSPVSRESAERPPLWVALLTGVALGFLAGLTGVGGGIFLSPLLLMLGWAGTRETSGVAAVFILVNSVAGLLGVLSSVAAVPAGILLWIPAVVLGGWVGAEFGSRRLPPTMIRRLLSIVLLLGGVKMILP